MSPYPIVATIGAKELRESADSNPAELLIQRGVRARIARWEFTSSVVPSSGANVRWVANRFSFLPDARSQKRERAPTDAEH